MRKLEKLNVLIYFFHPLNGYGNLFNSAQAHMTVYRNFIRMIWSEQQTIW